MYIYIYIYIYLFIYIYIYDYVLLSFPTRRSSDLRRVYSGHQSLACGLLVTGRAINLSGVEESGQSRGLQIRPEFSRINERSEEHTSELQSQSKLVCRLLLEKKKIYI